MCAMLPDVLAAALGLERLSLANNGLDDSSVRALCAALNGSPGGSGLVHLDLGCNHITAPVRCRHARMSPHQNALID